MGLKTIFKNWQATRVARRTEKLTARASDLKEGQPYDLLFLHDKGFVRAKATGQSVNRIFANVENLISKKLNVVIKPGTYFVSSGGHQNMASTAEYMFNLYPCDCQHLAIKAACINANRPIPKDTDHFYGVKRVSEDLARFLEATQHADPMVIQAGVWALTDGYSKNDIQSRLVSRDQYGNTRQAISDEQISEAGAILNGLGIRHALQAGEIWVDDFTIGQGTLDGFSKNLLPTEVDWSVKEFGTRVVGKVMIVNEKNRGAYILPNDGNYLLFVTIANLSRAEEMPKQGDRVEIEYVRYEKGDKCAITSASDHKMQMGHKVLLLRKGV